MGSGTISLSTTFAAFRHRNFRLWFSGQLISLVGSWMQEAALGFLMYSITQSAAYLGYVAFASGLPAWLLLLYGGVIADRVPRRTLILITKVVMMVQAFALAALAFSGRVQPWHVLALSFLVGAADAFEIPARQSLVADLVERDEMTNAIALNVTILNAGMIIGPAIAGIVYAAAGPGWCFLINGVSYLGVILALLAMKLPPQTAPIHRVGALESIRAGLQYVGGQPALKQLLFGAFAYNVVDYAMIIFIPAFAAALFAANPAVNGGLMTANAAGAVIGGLLLAAAANRIGRGRIWAWSAYLTPCMILVFAFSRSLPLSLLVSVIIGVTSITVLNNTQAMLLMSVPDELRGRVSSVYSLMLRVSGPLSSISLGLVSDRAGAPALLFICAGLALLFAAWVRLRAAPVREMA